MSKAYELGAREGVKLASFEKAAFLKNLLALLGKSIAKGSSGVANAVAGPGNAVSKYMASQTRLTPQQFALMQKLKPTGMGPHTLDATMAPKNYASRMVDRNFENLGGTVAGIGGGLGLAAMSGAFNGGEDRSYPYPKPTTESIIEGNR